MRVVLAELPKGSKKWWRLNSTLQSREGKCSSIPPLKENKKWILDPKEKANLFAKVWKAKSTLPPPNRPEVDFRFAGAENFSATGTRTQVAWVRATHPYPLGYRSGAHYIAWGNLPK